MRRIAFVFMLLALAVFEPEPVDQKPVFEKPAEEWKIHDKTVAFYRDCKLPDGRKVELKSKTPLTDQQWQKKADDYYKAVIEEETKLEICPFCGQEMP